MKTIIKVSPEITIKSRAVRLQFISRLAANLRKVCKQYNLSADVSSRWDMLEVKVDRKERDSDSDFQARCETLREILQHTPGIAHFYSANEFSLADPEAPEAIEGIVTAAVELMQNQLGQRSFAVRCKRQGKHSFGSSDVERRVGSAVLAVNPEARVQLKNPDTSLLIEIKKERFFITTEKISGIGGYPIGNIGQVLSLVSGGYDSCVASYDCMRRGLQTHFLFFNLGGLAHEVGVKQSSHYLWQRFAASHRTAFISVPFADVVEEIVERVDNAYMGVVLKRQMLRAADQIASAMHIPALVTGESIAQVSSQTLANLSLIDKVSDTLVLRPLISMDKSSIIERAVSTGVAEYAEHMPEYCAVISDKPTTAAKPSRLAAEEAKLSSETLQNAIASRSLSAIDAVYEQSLLIDEVSEVSTPAPGAVIIDLRNRDIAENKPLGLVNNQTLQIPAYKVNSEFAKLDADRNYLLFCERGTISRLHAAHLLAEGYKNVAVYSPE